MPQSPYLGMSAMTGEVHDNHECVLSADLAHSCNHLCSILASYLSRRTPLSYLMAHHTHGNIQQPIHRQNQGGSVRYSVCYGRHYWLQQFVLEVGLDGRNTRGERGMVALARTVVDSVQEVSQESRGCSRTRRDSERRCGCVVSLCMSRERPRFLSSTTLQQHTR